MKDSLLLAQTLYAPEICRPDGSLLRPRHERGACRCSPFFQADRYIQVHDSLALEAVFQATIGMCFSI